MKSRLLGVFVLSAVVLLAIAAGASNAGKKASPITLTMWSYDNQDPGSSPCCSSSARTSRRATRA